MNHRLLWGQCFKEKQPSGTSSDNEWYKEQQEMTTSGTTSDSERQPMKKSDNE